ncbi:MAG: hypothetical protein WC323_02825 [Patescibacteria group bacterium]|jgi:hypothetical protein
MIKNIKTDNGGIVLILTVIVMALLLSLGTYFMSFSMSDFKISTSHASAMQSYYLSEAGMNEMIYKLKNDPEYESEFISNDNWTQTLARENALFPDCSYSVTIANTSAGHGDITASSSVNSISFNPAQRIVKAGAFRASGGSSIGDNGAYADGNIDISYSRVNFLNGSAHSNNVFNVNGLSTVNIDNDLNAVGNFNQSWTAQVTYGGEIHAANFIPAAEYMAMPAVDFDSDDVNSFKSRADVIYTSSEFEDLMEDNQNLTLNDLITYVEGDVDVDGGQNLIVNGLLIVERDFMVGKNYCAKSRCGFSSVTVNHASSTPAGIFAKRKVEFFLWSGNINLNGIVYANDQMTIQGFPFASSFNAYGGLLGRKLTITSPLQEINIYHDIGIIADTLNPMFSSPIINIDHWEEEY